MCFSWMRNSFSYATLFLVVSFAFYSEWLRWHGPIFNAFRKSGHRAWIATRNTAYNAVDKAFRKCQHPP